MKYEAYIKEEKLKGSKNQQELSETLSIVRDYYLSSEFIEYYERKMQFPSWFIGSNTFGFTDVPKQAMPFLTEFFSPEIERMRIIKKHTHDYFMDGLDSSWMWLSCSDKECDASKQITPTVRAYKKYAVEQYKKNPELFNEYGKAQIENFIKEHP